MISSDKPSTTFSQNVTQWSHLIHSGRDREPWDNDHKDSSLWDLFSMVIMDSHVLYKGVVLAVELLYILQK